MGLSKIWYQAEIGLSFPRCDFKGITILKVYFFVEAHTKHFHTISTQTDDNCKTTC